MALLLALLPSLIAQVHSEYDQYAHLANRGQDAYHHVAWTAVGHLAAAVAGLLVVFVTGNRLGYLMRRLTHAAAAIAVGDYRKRVHIRTSDELEVLGETFNVLGESLADRTAALRRHADMFAGMAEAARIASSSLDLRVCARAVAKVVCTYLGARDAAVFFRNQREGGLKLLGYCGRRPRSVWKLVASRTADSGDYLLISEQGQGHARSEVADEATLVGVPLPTASGSVGAIVARFEGSISRSDVALGGVRAGILTTFGIHAAAALANAAAHSAAERYSETLENWLKDLSTVMLVTDAISPSLTLDETLEALARETARALQAELCAIFVPDRSGALVVKGCSDPEREALSKLRLGLKDTDTGRAFAERQTVTCRDTARSRFAATRKVTSQLGMRALLSTPLLVEDRPIGAITVYSEKPRRFGEREMRLLTQIGLHTAVIVRNASLYTREFSIAETLQSSLISEAPDEHQGLRFASRYIPAWDEAKVGGDFFDVTMLPNGKVGVVIGDVSGKGLQAAIHLAACKYMMKPLMFASPDDPAAVLSDLNSALNYYFEMSFFVTIFYGVIDPEEGVLEYANAGHVPGLLLTDGGKVHSSLGSTGIPAGSGYGCRYGSQRIRVSPRDILLLYTDGVIDAITEEGPLGIEGLHSMAFEAAATRASDLVDFIGARLAGAPQVTQSDDIALLAVSFEGVRAGRGSFVGGQGGQQFGLPTQSA